MKEEPHSKNQHYVPKLLLKKFSSRTSHVWVYDKEAEGKNWNSIKERPITKVASENYFYDKVQNIKEGSYEYELRKIEAEAAPIIEKIIAHENLNDLTENEREKLSYFIVVQNLRTKFQQKKIQDFTSDFNDIMNSNFNTNVEFEIDAKKIWFSILENANEYTKYIFNKIWFLGKSEQMFFSSDNPVVLQNTTQTDPLRGHLGIDSLGIEIYLPLNDSLILCMFCEKTLKHDNLNKFIRNKPILNFDAQNILNANSLQFYQSERFVISSRNNFDIIKEY